MAPLNVDDRGQVQARSTDMIAGGAALIAQQELDSINSAQVNRNLEA